MTAEGVNTASADGAISQISSEGATPVLIAIDGTLAGVMAVADEIRPEAYRAVAEIRKMGIAVTMLTGDNPRTANRVAEAVGIPRVLAGVLPEEKSREIERLQKSGQLVGMVGDGINDAPALAQSDVGIAMGSGTDIAIEAADMTILRGDLRRVVTALSLSRATIRTVKQNLFWAFVYNVIGIPLAAGALYPLTGWLLSPVIASAAMSLSSVSVLTNSLRLRNFTASEA
jgi:Cu+-exporting ATPase